jgi:transporter family protein
MTGWILPSLIYVALLGGYGVTTKLALRGMTWQQLLLWTMAAYAVAVFVVLATGTRPRFHGGLTGWMALLSACIPVLALIVFTLALKHGEARYVVPLTTAYPLVTLLLAAIALSESLSWRSMVGASLIVAGAVVVASA